jgi:uncharacterized protein (DUF2252 family)
MAACSRHAFNSAGPTSLDLRRLSCRQPGSARNADGDIDIDIEIRDLDQTVIGNPAHDLIRLALSLSTAARASDLPGVTTGRMLEPMMVGYQQALAGRRTFVPRSL